MINLSSSVLQHLNDFHNLLLFLIFQMSPETIEHELLDLSKPPKSK